MYNNLNTTNLRVLYLSSQAGLFPGNQQFQWLASPNSLFSCSTSVVSIQLKNAQVRARSHCLWKHSHSLQFIHLQKICRQSSSSLFTIYGYMELKMNIFSAAAKNQECNFYFCWLHLFHQNL